jgi:hypothetical protein
MTPIPTLTVERHSPSGLARALRRPLGLALALPLALALLACAPAPAEIADGDDPLAALKSPAPTSRYREPFWAQQSHRHTPLWRDALAFCKTGDNIARYPNCAHVRIVSFWDAPPPFPAPHFRAGDAGAAWQPPVLTEPSTEPPR